MNEFLSDNARKAYPLADILPAGVDVRWQQALLDASISYGDILEGAQRIYLLGVKRETAAAVFRIGVSATSFIDVSVPLGLDEFATVYGASASYKVLLTVKGPVITALVASGTPETDITPVNLPFVLRCTSSAIRRVTSVSAYAADLCTTPVFDATPRTPVRTLTDVLRLFAKEGLDLETTVDPVVGEVLRISALAAPSDTSATPTPVDMKVSGDDCLTVDAYPGVYVDANGIPHKCSEAQPPRPDTDSGILVVGSKCKPCCQCEDYKAAVDALRPAEAKTVSLEDILRDVKKRYDAATALFQTLKTQIERFINSYANLHAQATAVASGGVYAGSTAQGTRSRITLTLTVVNMTHEAAAISAVSASVPGFTPACLRWSLSGETPRSGDSLAGQSFSLKPGDTLSVVWTFASQAATNMAVKPSGMSATFTSKLPSETLSETRTVEAK